MAEDRPYYHVADVPDGVHANNGNQVIFVLRLTNGREMGFLCPYELMGYLVTQVTSFADMAMQERAKHGNIGPEFGIAIDLKGWKTSLIHGGEKCLRLIGKRGLNMDLVLTQQQIGQLIESLDKLRKAQPRKPPLKAN